MTNDNFANRVVVTGPFGSYSGLNIGYGKETGEGGDANATAWFQWTPTITAAATIDTHGSTFDTILGIWQSAGDISTDTVSTITLVDQDDDSTDTTSEVTFTPTSGNTYYFQVGGYAGNTGTYQLHWKQAVVAGTVAGFTTATVADFTPSVIPVSGIPDPVVGSTSVHVAGGSPPDFSGGDGTGPLAAGVSSNPPIDMALHLHGELLVVDPSADDLADPATTVLAQQLTGAGPGQLSQAVMRRSIKTVALVIAEPVIVFGKPTLPAHRGTITSGGTLVQGADHIHAIADPNPKWDGSGYIYPPPSPPWQGRWTVDDLPDPNHYGGTYWLGSPSRSDGSTGLPTGADRWAPHGDTPNAPSWYSFFPFKPSVRAVDHYLPDGSVVHHPKGVNFNPHYVEHMWCDFGSDHPQPFSWVIAGMITGFPQRHYKNFILDAGRNPDSVGFPRLPAEFGSRAINDGLDYRTMIQYGEDGQTLATRPTLDGFGGQLRTRADASVKPRMFYGVFNGTKSIVGARGTESDRHAEGSIDNGTKQKHRYYVLGRRQGWISQGSAAYLMVFEIRYWRKALSFDELNAQYAQLSTTYQFDRYRRI